jgi:hypothetical protein
MVWCGGTAQGGGWWLLQLDFPLLLIFLCCFGCTCNTIGGTEMSCWYIEGWAVECLVLVSWSLSFHSLCLGAY